MRVLFPGASILLLLLCWGISELPGTAQRQNTDTEKTSTADINETVTKITKATQTFLANRSNASGVTAEFREHSRTEEQGRTAVRYHAFVHGGSAVRTLAAFSWPINAQQPSKLMDGLTLGRDGIVMCAGRTPEQCGSPNQLDDPVEFTFYPAKGEPVRLMLISDDEKTTVYLGAVPEPLSKTDRGCTIEAIRLMPKWELVLIRAKGFKSNESVRFSSKSYDEAHDSEGKVDANGEYFSALLPFYKGKTSGLTDVRVTSPSCSPALSFEWGKI